MKEGAVLLAAIRQADGTLKNRPVISLRQMPPFGDFLVCGVSSQLQHATFLDEVIGRDDPDYRSSRLKTTSLIRLGFLAVLPKREIRGRIGSISPARHARLLTKLADFIRPQN
mgnify:CR=1 FL=1